MPREEALRRQSGVRGRAGEDSGAMGLLQGLLRARKLLLVVCVPLLLLPLPVLHPSSVSTDLRPPGVGESVGGQRGEVDGEHGVLRQSPQSGLWWV